MTIRSPGTRGPSRDREVPPETSLSIESHGLDAKTIEVLRSEGIEAFYPPQAQAIAPVLSGESVLLACPTASGKSLVAYLGLLRAARAGRTGLYLVPLRALAQEKYEELSAFSPLGIKVGISIGDFDLPAATLEKLDVLVATSEKADGLLRKGSPWLDRLGAVVADEVHLMRDPDRGPTLEVSLTRLRRHHPDLQVIALSATVGNSPSVAEWLGAVHIASDFRPVPLKMGVYRDGSILFTDRSSRTVDGRGEPLPTLVRTVVAEGGQALVFVNTRRASEQAAGALAATVSAGLGAEERRACKALAAELATSGEEETEGVRRLSGLVPHGVAFHNASLTNAERRLVERGFRSRTLKVLTATPTLAAGINLPARRVVVRDIFRYDARLSGNAPIPAMEVQQMCGRAGRPRFDTTGEAVLLARSAEEQERLLDEVLAAPPEDVESRLAAEPALRMHLLALVASGEVRTEPELEAFFRATFYGHTLPVEDLRSTVNQVREFLEEHDFLEPGDPLRATAFGHLTSDLYFDPLTAVVLRQALERAPIGVRPYALLAAIASTPDMNSVLVRRSEEAELYARFADLEPELLVKPEEAPMNLALDLFLGTLKTADILEAWTGETPVIQLTDRFGIGAGDLRARVEDAEWLLFGLGRIAVRFNRRVARIADDLALRVRYGVREELLDLVRLRGIGRVRGRALLRAGFPDRESLRNAPIERIEAALNSRALAEQVRRQLRPSRAGPVPVAEAPRPSPAPPPQDRDETRTGGRRRLEDF